MSTYNDYLKNQEDDAHKNYKENAIKDADLNWNKVGENAWPSVKQLGSDIYEGVASAIDDPGAAASGAVDFIQDASAYAGDAIVNNLLDEQDIANINEFANGPGPGTSPPFIPSGPIQSPMTDQLVQGYKDDYGTWDKAKRTFENDPASVALDLLPFGYGTGRLVKAGVTAMPAIPLRAVGEISKRVAGMATTGVIEGTGLGTAARVYGRLNHIADQAKKKLDKEKAIEVKKTEQYYKDQAKTKQAETDAAYTQNVKAQQAGMTPEEYMNAPAQPTLAERIHAREAEAAANPPPLESAPAPAPAPKTLDPKHQAILDQIRNRDSEDLGPAVSSLEAGKLPENQPPKDSTSQWNQQITGLEEKKMNATTKFEKDKVQRQIDSAYKSMDKGDDFVSSAKGNPTESEMNAQGRAYNKTLPPDVSQMLTPDEKNTFVDILKEPDLPTDREVVLGTQGSKKDIQKALAEVQKKKRARNKLRKKK